MNSCPECGAKVAENHKFCIECGQPLAGEQAAPAAADKITGGLSNYTQYFLLHLKDPLATLRQEQVDSFVEGLASIGLFTFMMFLFFYTSVKKATPRIPFLDLPVGSYAVGYGLLYFGLLVGLGYAIGALVLYNNNNYERQTVVAKYGSMFVVPAVIALAALVLGSASVGWGIALIALGLIAVISSSVHTLYYLDQAREKINPAYCALGLQMVFLIINYAIGKKFVSHLISAIRFW